MAPRGLLDKIIEDVGYTSHDEHVYIEIVGDSKIEVTQQTVHDRDIPDLCARPLPRPDGQWCLRFLIEIAGHSREDRNPYSKAAYEAILEHWHLPRIGFFHAITNTVWSFTPVYGDNDWEGLRLCLDFPLGWKLILSHHIPSRSTLAILNGDNATGFRSLIPELLHMAPHAYHPQLLPFLVMRSHVRSGLYLEGAILDDYTAIKASLRCSEYVGVSGHPTCTRPQREQKHEQELDMTDMPRKLTALLGELANSTSAITSQVSIIKYLNSLLGRSAPFSADQIVHEMRAQLCSMQHFCEDLRQTQSARKETVQAMAQMVYATLQQRDTQIAHRYGADMRIVAVIALLFLPGTFVAQVFSAPFWHFAPEDGEPLGRVYWGVTVALTLLVLGVWRGIIVLGKGKEDGGRRTGRLGWWGRWRGKAGEVLDEEKGGKSA